jgi:hypothetical protein
MAAKASRVLLVLLALSTFACPFLSASAVEDTCANSSVQASNLRVEKEKNASAIQILDKSAHWRVVFRSPAEINLPRQSPDTNFLAYVFNERGAPWLYLQRLSTGSKEPVSALEAKPADLCFDATAPVIHVIGPSGAVTDYDISPQLRLLPGR